MSETDSFIEEVSEEVRRDKLFALMRKYGWIGIALVLLIVGGAAYNEWRKADEMASAQQLGDGLLHALEQDDADARSTALAKVDAVGTDSQGLVKMLLTNEQLAAGDTSAASAGLTALANDTTLPKAYRDLATLKLVLLAGADMAVDEHRTKLAGLAVGGGAFRLLAEEQLALLDVDEGNLDAAISRLQDIIDDVEATAALQGRAAQLIVVLGGVADAS